MTYFILDKYIYNVEIIFNDGIVGILSYILCSELIYHFREITLGVPNLVGDGEIMQLVWRPTYPTIHEIKQYHLSDVPLV